MYNASSKMFLALERNLLITGYRTNTPTVIGRITKDHRAELDEIVLLKASCFTVDVSLLEDADLVWAYKNGLSVLSESTVSLVDTRYTSKVEEPLSLTSALATTLAPTVEDLTTKPVVRAEELLSTSIEADVDDNPLRSGIRRGPRRHARTESQTKAQHFLDITLKYFADLYPNMTYRQYIDQVHGAIRRHQKWEDAHPTRDHLEIFVEDSDEDPDTDSDGDN